MYTQLYQIFLIQIIYTVVWFQVFLTNTNNCMVSCIPDAKNYMISSISNINNWIVLNIPIR